MASEIRCRTCGQRVMADERGRIMLHTNTSYTNPTVCSGSDRGAKPASATTDPFKSKRCR